MREFIVDTIAYLSPSHAVEGLETADAERTVEGTNHSIAEIVAHIDFWQRWFIDRCEGVNAPMVGTAAEGWPSVPQGAWPEVRARFLEALERAAALGTNEAGLAAPLAPPIEFPPLAGYTVRDALVHVATHNAHHLGQVIVLRQMLGTWPPPAGSWTW